MKIIKRIFFSALIMTAFFLFVEFSVRAYFYISRGAFQYHTDKFVDLNWQGAYYDKRGEWANNLGFTGVRPLDPRKAKNEYRILAFGGSGTSGSWFSNWPDVLEKKLNQKSDRAATVKIINGGVGGHVSSRERKYFDHWLKLKPDLIIIYNGWNDVYYSHYLPDEYKDEFNATNSYFSRSFLHKTKDSIAEHSLVFRKLMLLKRALKTKLESRNSQKNTSADNENNGSLPEAAAKKNITQPEEKSQYSDVFEATFQWERGARVKVIDLKQPIEDNLSALYAYNLKEMVLLAAQHGIKVLLIQQPDCLSHAALFPEKFSEEDKIAFKQYIPHEGLRKDWIKAAGNLYPKAFQAMETLKQYDNVVEAVSFNDIFDDFSQKRVFWTDSCHQTAAGKEVIAAAIQRIIDEKKLINR